MGSDVARVLVAGGGITGLSAAYELSRSGEHEVEVWEAADRLGGKIATSPFGGVPAVDEGADAYLTRVPHAVELAELVGLGPDRLTAPTDATAQVWHGRLHDIPGGILLGVPAAIRPFVTTGLLSWRGKLRAAAEPLLPRRDPGDSLGSLVRFRFGHEVHERLVDALVGSIYATDTDRSSLAAVPQLAALASDNRSLLVGAMRARRAAPSGPGARAIFAAPKAGMADLVRSVAEAATAAGATIRLGREASTLEADGPGWRVDGASFDAVILATPAAVAARQLAGVAPAAAAALGRIPTADVIIVRLAVPGAQWPDRLYGLSGYLVPKPDQRRVTAASFGSQKWAHWRPASGDQILRVSIGRDGAPVDDLDDSAAIAVAVDEVGRHVGADLSPTAASVTRWAGAFPQYRPMHRELIAAIDADLPRGIAVAGASYRGVGIPACIADGARAACIVKESTAGADGFLS